MFYGVNILFTWLLILTTGAVSVSPPKAIRALDLPNEIKFEVVDGLMIMKIPTATGLSNFIFDTGSEQLILNDITEKATAQIVSVDHTYDVSDIVLDRLSLGKAKYDGAPALGMDLAFLSDQLGIEVNGILGAHIFIDYSLLIDYDNQVVELIDKLDSPGLNGENYDVIAIPFTQDNMDLPVIEIEIDGSLFDLGFDTGANICVFDHLKETQINACSSGGFELNSMKVNNARITKVPYVFKDFTEINLQRNTKIDGLISADVLATNKIFIDSNKNKIYLLWKKSMSIVSK